MYCVIAWLGLFVVFFLILQYTKLFQEAGHFDTIPVAVFGHILFGHNQTSFYPPILIESVLQHTISFIKFY